MRDIPLFTTDSGLSSLILKEIPYRQEAYIHIRQLQSGGLEEHLKECAAFCRMAGAERIYAAGEALLDAFPMYTQVLEMRGTAWVDREKLCSLFPVTRETAGRFREVSNARLAGVDNAATLEARDEEKLIREPGAYFVHEAGKLLGIGWLEDTKLLLVASAVPGAGERVMHTLMSLVEGSTMTLEVASTNERAIRLYERLGFVKTGVISQWHDVTGCR